MKRKNKSDCAPTSAPMPTDKFKKLAFKVAIVSIIGNALLSLFKLLAGIFAHSKAMVSDAIHSASDVFSSIIVIIGIKIASKASDHTS